MKTLILSCLLVIANIGSVSAEVQLPTAVDTAQTPNLVIFRDADRSSNGAVYYRLTVDGKHVGKLKRGAVLSLHLSEGEHLIRANDKARTEIAVAVDAQGITYVRGDIDKKRRLSLSTATPSEKVLATLSTQKTVTSIY